VIGEVCIGKSCLVLRFVQDKYFDLDDPTIEDRHQKDIIVDDKKTKLTILDTGGGSVMEPVGKKVFDFEKCLFFFCLFVFRLKFACFNS
jgi:GTPase SAR1 family protein